MEIEQPITIDLLADTSPALSTMSDIPRVETKPDSQPDPKPAPKVEVKPEAKVEDKAAPPSEVEESKTNSESATEHTEESTGEPEGKKPPRGVQKRLDELARREAEAIRRAESAEAERGRVLALLEKASKPEPKATEEDTGPQRPSRTAFADESAYDAALDEYVAEKASWSAQRAVKDALAAEAQKIEQRQVEDGRKAAQSAYQERVTKAQEKYADYREVAESPNVTVTVAMAQAILHTEHGPDIQYFLGKNPAEAQRISALNPAQQLVELGLIVGRLSAPQKEEPAPKPKPVVSNAPKPIKTLEAKSEPVAKTPDEESMEEYGARREKELRAERAGARR
jgi:hypothetical protein